MALAVGKARAQSAKVEEEVRAQVAKVKATPAGVAVDTALETKVTTAGLGVAAEGMALAVMVWGGEVAAARGEVTAAEETAVVEDAAAEAMAPAASVLAVEVAAAQAKLKGAEAQAAEEDAAAGVTAPAVQVLGAVVDTEAAEVTVGWRAAGGAPAEVVAGEMAAGATAKEEVAVRAPGKLGRVAEAKAKAREAVARR